MKKFISKDILYLLTSFSLGVIIFSLLRVVMYAIFNDRLETVDNAQALLLDSMFIGMKFDIIISCYIMLIPLLLVIISEYSTKNTKYLLHFVKIYIPVLYSFAFLLHFIDIPFFEQFNLRLNSTALNWMNSPKTVLGMIFSESSYSIYVLGCILFISVYLYIHKIIYKKVHLIEFKPNKRLMLPVLVVFLTLFTLGLRGSTSRPLRPNDAYFSNNNFVNQMTLNPLFFFIKTVIIDQQTKKINLVDSNKAKAYAAEKLSWNKNEEYITKDSGELKKLNVVVVFMESMSLSCLDAEQPLVPNLVSMREKSLSFSNIYSAGIHTYNGIYSTLFSYPGYMQHHTMNGFLKSNFKSILTEFKSEGYRTMFLLTHGKQFDNIGGFLLSNDIETVVDQSDYPAEEAKSSFGVPDHVMFNRAIAELNKVHKVENKPFLSYILTCSNHPPYYKPTDVPFTPRSEDLASQMIEYADWAINDFVRKASKCDWFDNTIFVFVGDHGHYSDSKYCLSLTFNHIPFLIYSPKHIKPETNDSYGCQMDIMPTICGIMNMSYTNRTFGIDLLDRHREYAYFSTDGKLAAINRDWLYVFDENSGDYLYRRSDTTATNCAKLFPHTLNNMRNYVFSMTQAAYDKANVK